MEILRPIRDVDGTLYFIGSNGHDPETTSLFDYDVLERAQGLVPFAKMRTYHKISNPNNPTFTPTAAEVLAQFEEDKRLRPEIKGCIAFGLPKMLAINPEWNRADAIVDPYSFIK